MKKDKTQAKKKNIGAILLLIIGSVVVLYLIGFRIGINPLPPLACFDFGTPNFRSGGLSQHIDTSIPSLGGCYSTRTIPFFVGFSPRGCLKIKMNICSEPSIEFYNKCDEKVRSSYYSPKRGPFFKVGKVGNIPYLVTGIVTWDMCKD